MDITTLAQTAASQAEHVVRRMIAVGWSVCHFHHLPDWLQVSVCLYTPKSETVMVERFRITIFWKGAIDHHCPVLELVLRVFLEFTQKPAIYGLTC